MPVFELEIDVRLPALASDEFIRSLLLEAGNKSFEVMHSEYEKTVLVMCEKKPRDSAIFGVRWLEPAGQKNAVDVSGNNHQQAKPKTQ